MRVLIEAYFKRKFQGHREDVGGLLWPVAPAVGESERSACLSQASICLLCSTLNVSKMRTDAVELTSRADQLMSLERTETSQYSTKSSARESSL